MISKKTEIILLLIILGIAGFFRLQRLDAIPPALYPDVAMNGNDALETLKTGNFRVFYPENNGREGLMMWLIALSFLIFGVSVWAIKIVSAAVGIFTVLGLYLLVKEIFSSQEKINHFALNINNTREFHQNENSVFLALVSSFFLAISFWHVNFSRIGFRAILLPFVLVFSFYFLLRGLRTKKIYNSLIAGLFFGFGFYTYTPFRLSVFILFFIFAFYFYWFFFKSQNIRFRKSFLIQVLLFFLITFIIALPLGIYFLNNPKDFINRSAPISIFMAENPLKEFLKSLILHLGMFNFYGDPNWRHNFSGSPMLFWPIGIFFLIGIVFSLKELLKFLKNKNHLLFPGYFLSVVWFLIMLLPGILTFEGIPHSLRVIGVVPPVFIFVSIGTWKIFKFLNNGNKNKKFVIFVSLFFLFSIGFAEYDKYFNDWAKNKKVAEAFTYHYYAIGNFLNNLPPETKKYVIVNEPGHPLYGISIPAQTPLFIERTKYKEPRAIYLKFEDLDQIKIDGEKTIIVPLYDGKIFEELSKKFPRGIIKTGKNFQFYEIF